MRTSLHRRVVVAFGFFACLLSMLFAVVVWGALHLAEDRMVARYLRLERDDYLARVAREPTTPLPATRWLRGTFDPTALPVRLQAFAEGPDGVYEQHRQGPEDPTELTLLVHAVGPGRRLYLWVDTAQVEAIDASMGFMGLSLLLAVVGVTTFGIALGHATARRVIAPVMALADRVAA